MPLEDLTGNKYINSLVETWPAGTDKPDAGDDHIRGIKNVLKKTFPNVTGPVTLTQDVLNRGSIPSGSVMLFWQAAAPVGWTRVDGITTTHGLRVVTSVTAGGTSGGSDDPILNDKVPSHSHAVNAVNTGSESADHTHAGYTNVLGAHTHSFVARYGTINDQISPVANQVSYADNESAGSGTIIPASDGNHQHSVQTYGRSAAHVHTVPAHSTNANAGAVNWTPRYMDVIVCRKD
jgi:hypothetical protein